VSCSVSSVASSRLPLAARRVYKSSTPSRPPVSFFFNKTPPTEIYTLSLHDALPILSEIAEKRGVSNMQVALAWVLAQPGITAPRSEEHTSELQSRSDLVCRLLLEKKKKKKK